MSELEDLIAIYRAIDSAVATEREAIQAEAGDPDVHPIRDIAARYIPAYADTADEGDVTGWTVHVDNFFGGERPLATLVSASERAEVALDNIYEDPPTGRMQSRLLPPLAAYFRIRHDDHIQSLVPFDDDPFIRAAEAFEPKPNIVGRSLTEFLYNDDFFRTVDDWESFKQNSFQAGVLLQSVMDQPVACTGTPVVVKAPDEDIEVTRLATTIDSGTRKITAKQVAAFLDPMNWKKFPLYCDMIDAGASPDGSGHRYIEVLSPCCDKDPDKMRVCLVMHRSDSAKLKQSYTLSYRLCADKTMGNGKVVYDQGEVSARKSGKKWIFDTIKYVRFDGVANGAIFSLVACALGYATYAEDFLLNM